MNCHTACTKLEASWCPWASIQLMEEVRGLSTKAEISKSKAGVPRGLGNLLCITLHFSVLQLWVMVASHQDCLQAQCRCSAASGLCMLPAKAISIYSHTQYKATAQQSQAHSMGQSHAILCIIKTLLFSI